MVILVILLKVSNNANNVYDGHNVNIVHNVQIRNNIHNVYNFHNFQKDHNIHNVHKVHVADCFCLALPLNSQPQQQEPKRVRHALC